MVKEIWKFELHSMLKLKFFMIPIGIVSLERVKFKNQRSMFYLKLIVLLYPGLTDEQLM